MQKYVFLLFLITVFVVFPNSAKSQNQVKMSENEVIEKTKKIISEVIEQSYPELKTAKIKVKTFQSESNYFKSRFSYTRYLTFQKLQYLLVVNPQVFIKNAPENGIRAIIAHELAHVLYYEEKNRFQLFGLVSLADKILRRNLSAKPIWKR